MNIYRILSPFGKLIFCNGKITKTQFGVGRFHFIFSYISLVPRFAWFVLASREYENDDNTFLIVAATRFQSGSHLSSISSLPSSSSRPVTLLASLAIGFPLSISFQFDVTFGRTDFLSFFSISPSETHSPGSHFIIFDIIINRWMVPPQTRKMDRRKTQRSRAIDPQNNVFPLCSVTRRKEEDEGKNWKEVMVHSVLDLTVIDADTDADTDTESSQMEV